MGGPLQQQPAFPSTIFPSSLLTLPRQPRLPLLPGPPASPSSPSSPASPTLLLKTQTLHPARYPAILLISSNNLLLPKKHLVTSTASATTHVVPVGAPRLTRLVTGSPKSLISRTAWLWRTSTPLQVTWLEVRVELWSCRGATLVEVLGTLNHLLK